PVAEVGLQLALGRPVDRRRATRAGDLVGLAVLEKRDARLAAPLGRPGLAPALAVAPAPLASFALTLLRLSRTRRRRCRCAVRRSLGVGRRLVGSRGALARLAVGRPRRVARAGAQFGRSFVLIL